LLWKCVHIVQALKEEKTQYFAGLALRFIVREDFKGIKNGWMMLNKFLLMDIDELLGLG
jgi:hypothetical protein